ncbi:MAG: NAD-dependent deacylase [Bacteroidota bacterium]|nr:NAD-dependent deacylase [Bacteroidota bacterium]MDP4191781.1 NAD-dependent deacylase [Bacteroidota bacterium]MDP4195986.1 NAD-dependent deacylase [Bacteroidota bacterium]
MNSFKPEFIEKLKRAESIVFFTGAGVSAESGISTFRGTDGIWNRLKPEELANFDAFMRNPERVWEWYQYRKQIIHQSKPNAAHIAIAEFQNYFNDVVVVTQNVDNLHRRAGSKVIYELHGNIERNYCIKCKTEYNQPDLSFPDKKPKCKCGGLIRPDIVWFGEMLPEDQFSASEAAAQRCDIIFVVGTSAVVYPAAQIPLLAKRFGAYLVEINLERTEISSLADCSLLGKAGEIFPDILKEVKQIRSTEKLNRE